MDADAPDIQEIASAAAESRTAAVLGFAERMDKGVANSADRTREGALSRLTRGERA